MTCGDICLLSLFAEPALDVPLRLTGHGRGFPEGPCVRRNVATSRLPSDLHDDNGGVGMVFLAESAVQALLMGPTVSQRRRLAHPGVAPHHQRSAHAPTGGVEQALEDPLFFGPTHEPHPRETTSGQEFGPVSRTRWHKPCPSSVPAQQHSRVIVCVRAECGFGVSGRSMIRVPEMYVCLGLRSPTGLRRDHVATRSRAGQSIKPFPATRQVLSYNFCRDPPRRLPALYASGKNVHDAELAVCPSEWPAGRRILQGCPAISTGNYSPAIGLVVGARRDGCVEAATAEMWV